MYNHGKPEDIQRVHCKDQFYCDKNDRSQMILRECSQWIHKNARDCSTSLYKEKIKE